MRGVRALGAEIKVVVLDKGGPILGKCVFDARAKRPSRPKLAQTVGRYARRRVVPAVDVKGACWIQTVLAKLPRPATLGIDQRMINSCADTTRDGDEARDLIVAGKTDARGGDCTCIEAAAMAVDVSPVSIGLDSENGPLTNLLSS
jgi:hypothetical protein